MGSRKVFHSSEQISKAAISNFVGLSEMSQFNRGTIQTIFRTLLVIWSSPLIGF